MAKTKTFAVVHQLEASDYEHAETMARKMRVPFTKLDTPLLMVAEVANPEDDIEIAMSFLPPEAVTELDGNDQVIICTNIREE